MDIVEWMGLAEKIQAKKTGTERLTLFREGISRPVHVEMSRLMTAVSDRHVEIMRDDLTEIFYDATRGEVEYMLGDSITSISGNGEVTFEQGVPRRSVTPGTVPAPRSVAAPAWPLSAHTSSPASWPRQVGIMCAASAPTNTSWATMHGATAQPRLRYRRRQTTHPGQPRRTLGNG